MVVLVAPGLLLFLFVVAGALNAFLMLLLLSMLALDLPVLFMVGLGAHLVFRAGC